MTSLLAPVDCTGWLGALAVLAVTGKCWCQCRQWASILLMDPGHQTSYATKAQFCYLTPLELRPRRQPLWWRKAWFRGERRVVIPSIQVHSGTARPVHKVFHEYKTTVQKKKKKKKNKQKVEV